MTTFRKRTFTLPQLGESLAMAGLPADQRLALALYHQDGLSVAEIAVITETPAGTVKTRLMHARRKLAAVLNPTQD